MTVTFVFQITFKLSSLCFVFNNCFYFKTGECDGVVDEIINLTPRAYFISYFLLNFIQQTAKLQINVINSLFINKNTWYFTYRKCV